MGAITNQSMSAAIAALAVAAGLSISPSQPHAAAQPPPKFPNLNDFTTVPVDDYLITYLRGRRIVGFSTPDNVVCDFDAPINPTPPTPRIHCAGDLPGMANIRSASSQPRVPGACTAGTVDFSPSGKYELLSYDWRCGDVSFRQDDFPYWSGRLLDRGERLSYGNVACAVGADALLACLDTSNGDHGFVLQPSGSWTF